MPAGFIQTENIDLAAAFRVLGFMIKSDKCSEELSGRGWTKMLIGAVNVPSLAFCKVGKLSASVIKRALADPVNPLWLADPSHPMVEVLAVYHNRQAILDAMHKGTAIRLNESHTLERGEESSAIKNAPAMVSTGDISIAAALTRMGFPLARIQGTPPQCKLFMADPAQRAAQLVRLCRECALDEQNPEHVRFGQLLTALEVRDAVRDYVTKREQRILLINPRRRHAVNPLTSPSALIPASASNKTLDQVRKHILKH